MEEKKCNGKLSFVRISKEIEIAKKETVAERKRKKNQIRLLVAP